jgi:phospholipase D1/2
VAESKKRGDWASRSRNLTKTAITHSVRRTSTRHKRPVWQKLVPPLAIMLALFLVWRFTPLADELTAQHIIEWARETGRVSWSPVAVVCAYVAAAFIMFPRPLITLLSIIAYGPWPGFAVSMVGIVCSAAAVYYAGKALPESTLFKLGGDKLEAVGETLRKHGTLAALAVSIVPVAPFPLVGMTAGAAGIKLWQFLIGATVGMLPGTIATVLFTDQVLAALEHEQEVNYWIVAAVAVVFAVVMFFMKRWLTKVHR